MATPTRSQMASTPKNPLTSTPSRLNASPRSNLGAFANKYVAGKSPAVKTPASSIHAHRISVSSHPTSTPLAPSTLPEDLLNLNSPSAAALMASMGPTGLTPLPTAQDGLGITGGLSGMGGISSIADGHASKNPQKDRSDRLREVAETLRTTTGGRGISRDTIQNLAKIHGFATLSLEDDENVVTIAGDRFVELEVSFNDHHRDIVDKTCLKLNYPDHDDGILQENASRVLTNNLKLDQQPVLPWHDLSDFSANLQYLNYVEHISTGSNGFNIIDNLYDTFQKIWIEEKKRMKYRHDMHHLCQSNVGEPQKDTGSRLGLKSRYWTKGQPFFAKNESALTEQVSEREHWTATFSIEEGPPLMSSSQNWLAEDALTSTVRAEDIFQESAIDKPSWQQPDTLLSQKQPEQNVNAMDVDRHVDESKEMLNLHFTCTLEPEILLPVHAAQKLGLTQLHSDQLISFEDSIRNKSNPRHQTGERWIRTQHTFDQKGNYEERKHSYHLYTPPQFWAHPVKKLVFTHPRQYAEAIPVLRQYALVHSLLQSISPPPLPVSTRNIASSPNNSKLAASNKESKNIPIRGKVTKRSNKSQLESKLASLANPSLKLQQQITVSASDSANFDEDDVVPIDVSFDPTPNPTHACRLLLRVSLSSQILSRSAAQRLKAKPFILIQIDILLNGSVVVVNIQGVELSSPGEENDKERLEGLKKRMGHVVRASEDVGMIVWYLLQELEKL